MVANGVLASLQPCDVPTTVRLRFSLTAALLPTILNILHMKSLHHSVIRDEWRQIYLPILAFPSGE